MSEEGERPRFDPTGFALVVTFLVFSAASFATPGYAGVGDPWRWIIYAIGILSFVVGCIGFMVSVGHAYGGQEGFLLSLYVLGLFTVVSVLHLFTAYIPMWGWLYTAARLAVYVLVLPLSLLTMVAVFRILGAVSPPENRTDAVLALLALIGALIPILLSLTGSS